MASASSKSAKTLFAESKMRLSDRVQVNINNIASLARQIQRGSKTSDIMLQSARQMASQEHLIINSESNLNSIRSTLNDWQAQQDSLMNYVVLLEEAKEQIAAMQR